MSHKPTKKIIQVSDQKDKKAKKVHLKDSSDLFFVTTPEFTRVNKDIASLSKKVYDLNIKKDTIAIVSDGSSVRSENKVSPEAVRLNLEKKAIFFREFADLDAFPIFVNSREVEEFIIFLKEIAPLFAGIHLEAIETKKCVDIECALGDLGVPIFHDDRQGCAINLMAAIYNAALLAGKELKKLRIVINGLNSTGEIFAKLLLCSAKAEHVLESSYDVLLCDEKGILSTNREEYAANHRWQHLAQMTNKDNMEGSLQQALVGADVFVDLQEGHPLTGEFIQVMNDKPVIFSLTKRLDEFDSQLVREAGVFVLGSDLESFPNQINNSLVYPGIFRGTVDSKAKNISSRMQMAAAMTLAENTEGLNIEKVLPFTTDKKLSGEIALSVIHAFEDEIKEVSGNI